MNKTLYFVTLNWNTTNLLKDMITSVEATTRQPHRWIILDNGSDIANETELYDWLHQQFDALDIVFGTRQGINLRHVDPTPDSVLVIRSADNLGCIIGHDIVFEAVRVLNGDQPHEIVMIDTDVVVTEENWLNKVLAWADERPQAGIVGLEHSKAEICAPAVFLDPAGYWYIHEGQPGQAEPVEAESVGLGMALIRWPVLEARLRFDPVFQMYYKQDDDFCFQVRANLGLEVWAFPIGCIHYGAGSLKANEWQVGRYSGKDEVDNRMKRGNQQYFARKWQWALRPRRQSLAEEACHLAEMKQTMAERRQRHDDLLQKLERWDEI